MFKKLHKLLTEHPGDTANPQSYWQHGRFAGWNSLILIYGGILGVIHAFLPFIFPFNTSTIVIKSFMKIAKSGRHTAELKREGVIK